MPSDLILITGGTGHVGFGIIVDALKAGYTVRAAIRDQSKKASILAAKSIIAHNLSPRLSFIVVPDITTGGAYDAAVKGVKYIIHVASPLANIDGTEEEFQSRMIDPAIKGTIGILRSAQKTNGIKRVVITSSISAIIPPPDPSSGSIHDAVVNENSEAQAPVAPFGNMSVAYSAAKINAFKATKDFITNEKPVFDIVSIMPGFVVGKNELVTDPSKIVIGSNGFVMGQVLGSSIGIPIPGVTVHLDDLSRAHVLALDPKIPGNTHYLASSGGIDGAVWGDAIGIVAKNFPRAVAAGTLPNNGVMKTAKSKVDASKTEKVFGIKFLDYEEQVKNVVTHYLELVGAKAA